MKKKIKGQMGRPLKDPADRHSNSLRLPLTNAEREAVDEAAALDGEKSATWARAVLLRAVKIRNRSGS